MSKILRGEMEKHKGKGKLKKAHNLAPTLYLSPRHNQAARIYQEINGNENNNYKSPEIRNIRDFEIWWDTELLTSEIGRNRSDIVLWDTAKKE